MLDTVNGVDDGALDVENYVEWKIVQGDASAANCHKAFRNSAVPEVEDHALLLEVRHWKTVVEFLGRFDRRRSSFARNDKIHNMKIWVRVEFIPLISSNERDVSFHMKGYKRWPFSFFKKKKYLLIPH